MVKTDGTSDLRRRINKQKLKGSRRATSYGDELYEVENQIAFYNDEVITFIAVAERTKDMLYCEWEAKVTRNRWKDQAKQRMLRQIEHVNEGLKNLSMMKEWCSIAQEALEANDVDGLFESATKIERYRNKFVIPILSRAGSRKWGSEGGLISERPPNPLTIVLIEIGKEIESYDTADVKAWWQSLTSSSDCIEGVGYKYECYYEMELYRYHLDGDQRVTGREIEQELYRIRIKQSK